MFGKRLCLVSSKPELKLREAKFDVIAERILLVKLHDGFEVVVDREQQIGQVVVDSEFVQLELVLFVEHSIQSGKEIAEKILVLDVEKGGRIVHLVVDYVFGNIFDHEQILGVQAVGKR